MTAPDVSLLHRLAMVTGDSAYTARALLEWANIKTFWPRAADLDALFRSINRRLGAWDLAAYLEAAKLSGDDAHRRQWRVAGRREARHGARVRYALTSHRLEQRRGDREWPSSTACVARFARRPSS